MSAAFQRPVSARLAIAIFLVPGISAWFTLREGYSVTARVVSFLWALPGALLGLAILSVMFSSEPSAFDKGMARAQAEAELKGSGTNTETIMLPPKENAVETADPTISVAGQTSTYTAAPSRPPAQPEWAKGLPGYDIKAHCNSMGNMGGSTSYGVIEMCQDQEMSSVKTINSYWAKIPSETQAHCNQMATMGGTGSYGVLKMCIEQELASRGRVR